MDTLRRQLGEGDVDAAWANFLDSRCTILVLYNRYYSDIRTTESVADPREAAIDPASVGCGR